MILDDLFQQLCLLQTPPYGLGRNFNDGHGLEFEEDGFFVIENQRKIVPVFLSLNNTIYYQLIQPFGEYFQVSKKQIDKYP